MFLLGVYKWVINSVIKIVKNWNFKINRFNKKFNIKEVLVVKFW